MYPKKDIANFTVRSFLFAFFIKLLYNKIWIKKRKDYLLKIFFEENKIRRIEIMQKLPIGIQNFEAIRKKEYLYIDKTKQILKLIENGECYFLSRPRR